MRVARYEADYSHYLVWTVKLFNNNVLQHFHQKIMITSITYSIANHYYKHYLAKNREPVENPENISCRPKTEIPMITSTSQIEQVIPFSLFHCASNAPQTKKRQAFNVILTHRNKIEMPYQVMRDIARNGYPHILISPSPYTPIDL